MQSNRVALLLGHYVVNVFITVLFIIIIMMMIISWASTLNSLLKWP